MYFNLAKTLSQILKGGLHIFTVNTNGEVTWQHTVCLAGGCDGRTGGRASAAFEYLHCGELKHVLSARQIALDGQGVSGKIHESEHAGWLFEFYFEI